MITALSDVSSTNQLKLMESPEDTAEKLFRYLFGIGRGIESFSVDELDLAVDWETIEEEEDGDEEEDEKKQEKGEVKAEKFRQQHRLIKSEIQKRLAAQGETWSYGDIQYFSSYSSGKRQIFFLSPNQMHSGWTAAFCKLRTDRERIFNLIFKLYLLSEELPVETLNGFEELLLVHIANLTKPKPNTKRALMLWGQNILIKYNQHDVLTLTLTRKKRRFYPTDKYSTVDTAELGEMILHKNKNYYFSRNLDGRLPNSIKFMRFYSKDKEFKRFKKTQVYLYQFLMKKLAAFLDACGIAYQLLPFQATHYLENSFMKQVETVETLEIINNSGADLTEADKQMLENVLGRQGVITLSFYKDGQTISTYERIPPSENEIKPRWAITPVIPWTDVKLSAEQNYLVLNKMLDPETESSMAYRQADGVWRATKKIGKAETVDFYSQLKRSTRFMKTGIFTSVQGFNVAEFKMVGLEQSSPRPILEYPQKMDLNALDQDAQPFTDGQFLETESLIQVYLRGQQDSEQLGKFCDKHKIDFSPEFEKILIELDIKNMIRKSLLGEEIYLPVKEQPFDKKPFFAINVSKRRRQAAEGVAVEFLYEKGRIYIKGVMRDLDEILKRFPDVFRYKIKVPDELVNQEYFADEEGHIYISAYTSDDYTPTLTGRPDILERLESGTLEINRQKASKLFPLVTYYNDDVDKVKDLVCLDLSNDDFIQYYVPPVQTLKQVVKNGFRVYHLIGKPYPNPNKEIIPTAKLINHPIAILHFNTLTQNILKISENSQSSLLQKVAKVLIEN